MNDVQRMEAGSETWRQIQLNRSKKLISDPVSVIRHRVLVYNIRKPVRVSSKGKVRPGNPVTEQDMIKSKAVSTLYSFIMVYLS